MRFARVHYDTCNQQFRLNGHEVVDNPEDGATYLIADLSLEDFLPGNHLKLARIAHQNKRRPVVGMRVFLSEA